MSLSTYCTGVYYSATAHSGGTVKTEANHITAQFFKGDKKGKSNKGPIPSSWTDKSTGKVKVGEKDQHHIYINDKQKVPSSWSRAVDASHARKTAAKEKEKDALNEKRVAKVAEAKKDGESIQQKMSPEEKKTRRGKKKEEKADRKEKAERKKEPGAAT